ncbi:erythromycin esterase family protein [Fredinandcohnia sp. QZ13]|uniref:erythromycin esterase family protein n=1 Tax=Fredinandcohnia sp. QZ13 TaxID=3073144 RepID=UPI00285351B5|nr:erythromycin esterase family protein [Fredinandcohnia sp. QZ13]MDR4885960.1 erythromycin esterase family protein [Fredinandcohnia sp. QZ13]
MVDKMIQAIQQHSIPIRNPKEDLEQLVISIKNEKYILLGESSHGTSEFYKNRKELTKKLIVEKDFTFIAVEGDWPACQEVNRYIKGYSSKYNNARDVLMQFKRWPTWMWANEEIIDLIEWLKEYNQGKPSEKMVGFYGIDIYSLWESMDEIIKYLEKRNSPDLEVARQAFACFEPFNREAEKYALSSAFYSEGCHEEVTKLLTGISVNKHIYHDSEESSLNVEVNALIAANAENYYTTMITNDNESWNIRDRHMVEVIHKIDSFYNHQSKGIIWEHNTHVGDARATDMANEGIVNVGQLLREQAGSENVYIVGFGTHHGTVIAASEWGENFEKMKTPPATTGSWEDLLYKAGNYDKLLLFTDKNRHLFANSIGHRAIGVIYHPQYEHYGNYVPSVISERYDAFIFVNHTNALTPLEVRGVLI